MASNKRPKLADVVSSIRKDLRGRWQPGCLCRDIHGRPCQIERAEQFSLGGFVQATSKKGGVNYERMSAEVMANIAIVLFYTCKRFSIIRWEDEPGRTWLEIEGLLKATETALRSGDIVSMQRAFLSNLDMQVATARGQEMYASFLEKLQPMNGCAGAAA